MTEKKEIKEKKVIKPAPTVKKTKTAEKPKKVEQQFFAKDLAERMGVTSFDFFVIKREAGIEDGTPITMTELKKLYNKIIKG